MPLKKMTFTPNEEKSKLISVPAFLKFEDSWFNTKEVMKEILKIFNKSPDLSNEDISKQTGLPVEIVENGIKCLQKIGLINTYDPKKQS